MNLVKARIRDFRCVEDSGDFSLKSVTCLVGKNESGKTAILQALHLLKPNDDKSHKFEPARDYPKRKWLPNQPVPDSPPVVYTEWILDQNEQQSLDHQFGTGTVLPQNIKVTKGYKNQREFEITIDESCLVKHLIAFTRLTPEEKKELTGSKTLDILHSKLRGMDARTPNQEKLVHELTAVYEDGAQKTIERFVDNLLPTFLYFDQYQRLPGKMRVEQLLERKQQAKLTEQDNIFLALLELAGTTIEGIHGSKTFEEFNSSLRAISNHISDQIFEYWTQNKHLDVELRLDAGKPLDPEPFNAGTIFRTRINNRRHRADTDFDERSSGFVWFFSFLIWFNSLSNTYKKNLVVLLDEPGLSLHARAQADLLRYINEKLKPEYQVVYTTHSPFMIDSDNLLSARTVEDVVVKGKTPEEEVLLGTKVNEDVLSTDADTVSPLQRALDYQLTQTLFVGRHVILIEGSSDFLYLKWFSKQLEKKGKPGLDYRWTLSIIGGIDRIPGFISLFRGNNLHVAAFVDVQHGNKQRIDNARKALGDSNLLTADKYANQKEADIEDVMGREFYISLVNRAYHLDLASALPALKPADAPDRVVVDVENRFKTMPPFIQPFTHETPAEFLFQDIEDGSTLPGFDKAIAAVDQVINDLNALMVVLAPKK